MLIKRVYEVDPLACPCCGGQMKIISFIERRQADVIERVLRHAGGTGGDSTPGTAQKPSREPHEARVHAEKCRHLLEDAPLGL